MDERKRGWAELGAGGAVLGGGAGALLSRKPEEALNAAYARRQPDPRSLSRQRGRQIPGGGGKRYPSPRAAAKLKAAKPLITPSTGRLIRAGAFVPVAAGGLALMDRGEKRLADNPVGKALPPKVAAAAVKGKRALKNPWVVSTAGAVGGNVIYYGAKKTRKAPVAKGYPGEWRIPSSDYRVGINPFRPNPISPLSMLTGSRMAADAIVGASGRNMNVIERRKRTKEARKLAYQLAQAGGLVYRPAGAAGVFGL